MKVQDFELTILPGQETQDGYVKLAHDTKYQVHLQNHGTRRCDAELKIDGKLVGAWRVDPRGHATLERPANDNGCFTFYRVGSDEAAKAGFSGVALSDLGLVQVHFRVEREDVREVKTSGFQPRSTGGVSGQSMSFGAGGTGLSGQSSQQFSSTAPLQYDPSREVVITLRLVEGKEEVRPLVANHSANPVPNPV